MKNTATVIVQARMGSTRCPGKSMELIGGLPVVEVVLKRLAKANHVDNIILATTDLNHDTVLAETAKNLGFDVFRGSESDLVTRYVNAAEKFATGPYIVRATGDNVFMDWNEVDRQICAGISGKWDFVGFHNTTYTERENDFGTELIRVQALRRVDGLTQDPYDREHVNPYFYAHSDSFRVTRLDVSASLHTAVKLDLDTQEDLALIKRIGDQLDNPVDALAVDIVRIAERLS